MDVIKKVIVKKKTDCIQCFLLHKSQVLFTPLKLTSFAMNI